MSSSVAGDDDCFYSTRNVAAQKKLVNKIARAQISIRCDENRRREIDSPRLFIHTFHLKCSWLFLIINFGRASNVDEKMQNNKTVFSSCCEFIDFRGDFLGFLLPLVSNFEVYLKISFVKRPWYVSWDAFGTPSTFSTFLSFWQGFSD